MTSKRKRTLCLPTLILFLLFPVFCGAGSLSTPDTITPENSIWTWAGKAGSQHAVFISRQTGSEWGDPEKVSDNNAVNVVPAVTWIRDNSLFVIWSAFSGQQAQLHYRHLQGKTWDDEKEYYSGLSSNTAPNIAVDSTGKLWLVWAGFNGISDEIYFTTWNGNSFETATPITSNDIPDILPVLGINPDSGRPWVQWQQYSDSGYVQYESLWDGSEWTSPQKVPLSGEEAVNEQESQAVAHASLIKRGVLANGEGKKEKISWQGPSGETSFDLEIPPFITGPESASIHVPGYEIQSLPVRSMVVAEELQQQ